MDNDYSSLKNDAIASLSAYMDSLDSKRARILAYWIRDYVRFLKKEQSFDPTKLIRYKRGSIVKAHLGYRIGSEEGGLHYGIVLDVKNDLNSQIVTIVPLTSLKPQTDLEHLHSSKLYLGDEIYCSLSKKLDDTIANAETIKKSLLEKLAQLREESGALDPSDPDFRAKNAQQKIELDLLSKQIDIWKAKCGHAQKMEEEISKMKRGSIALLSQITTISKIRIYDPLYPSDNLTSIRISNNALDKIDAKIKELYTNTH